MQDKLRKTAPFIFFIILLAIIGGYFLLGRQKSSSSDFLTSLKNPPARTVQLTGDGKNHTVKDLGIASGFYEFNLRSGKVDSFPLAGLNNLGGEKTQVYLTSADTIRLSKASKIVLKPSNLKALKSLTFRRPGMYLVGQQIPAGDYRITTGGTWNTMSESSSPTTLTITAQDEEGNILKDNEAKNIRYSLSLFGSDISGTVVLTLKDKTLLTVSFYQATPDTAVSLIKIK
ncbi:hypothetical protein OfM1_09120 [Lactovum odontotermitis]